MPVVLEDRGVSARTTVYCIVPAFTLERVVSAIQKMEEQVSTIASAVEEQNAVTAEIASSTQGVAAGSHTISETIGSVSEAAGDSNRAASDVMTTVGQLGQQSVTLREELDRFLTKLRAA